jgi:transcriptional regulator GlxA family with amidase domain
MRFGFLLFDGVEELDFVGPWEMVGMWGLHFGGPEQRITLSRGAAPVRCVKGLRVATDHDFDNCPQLDYLLVPGGDGRKREVHNPDIVAFIQRQAPGCRAVTSVCTGAFLLHAAGLLNGKKATTYWHALNELRQRGGVEVVEQRFVRDANIWCAAGVSAGIDMTLALIAHEAGDEVAGQVQLAAEYYPASTRYGSAHRNPDAPAYLR